MLQELNNFKKYIYGFLYGLIPIIYFIDSYIYEIQHDLYQYSIFGYINWYSFGGNIANILAMPSNIIGAIFIDPQDFKNPIPFIYQVALNNNLSGAIQYSIFFMFAALRIKKHIFLFFISLIFCIIFFNTWHTQKTQVEYQKYIEEKYIFSNEIKETINKKLINNNTLSEQELDIVLFQWIDKNISYYFNNKFLILSFENEESELSKEKIKEKIFNNLNKIQETHSNFNSMKYFLNLDNADEIKYRSIFFYKQYRLNIDCNNNFYINNMEQIKKCILIGDPKPDTLVLNFYKEKNDIRNYTKWLWISAENGNKQAEKDLGNLLLSDEVTNQQLMILHLYKNEKDLRGQFWLARSKEQ